MDALHELAAEVGLLTHYRAQNGDRVDTPAEDLLATLQLWGIEIDGPAGARTALRHLRQRRARRALPPVVVAWDGVLPPVPVGGKGAGRTGVGAAELRLADGRTVPAAVRDGEATVDRRLPLGEHELEAGGAVAHVLAAPAVAWRPAPGEERRWGLFVPTYALRTARTRGIGDLGDLRLTFDWLHRRGGQVVVTLPMLATFLDPPAVPSPYAPVSRRYWNECLADLAGLPGADRLPEPGGDLVDYDGVWAARRPVLAAAAEAFFASGAGADYDRWLAERPAMAEYARFRAAGSRHGRNWRAWPSRLPTDVDAAEERLHLFGQYTMDRQLAALDREVRDRGQFLALDLALGTHPDGYDVWRERHLFVDGASAGAPPDTFFPRGQDWGFPPLHPEASREEGHRYLRDCIRHHLRYAGLLRIDHILGLLRVYWVRADAGPQRGVYVRYPLDELLAVICLEAARAGAMVVGENLGTVPPEVTEAMADHGVLGCAVGQFDVYEALDTGHVTAPAAPNVATMNTHDTATFAAFWQGADIDDRSDLGLLDDDEVEEERKTRDQLRRAVTADLGLPDAAGPADVLVALTGVQADSDAALVVVNVEDGWAATGPQNVPGTTEERPNWRRRVAVPLEAWEDVSGLDAVLSRVERARPRPTLR